MAKGVTRPGLVDEPGFVKEKACRKDAGRVVPAITCPQ
jgi:hypothetical protein